MRKFIQEFREFIARGNVIDLAVAVVMGSAFSKIVTSLVGDIIMPLIGIITGGHNISGLAVTVGKAKLEYGAFLQATVDFILIALSIFLMLKVILLFKAKIVKDKNIDKEKEDDKIETQEELLADIRNLLREKMKKTDKKK